MPAGDCLTALISIGKWCLEYWYVIAVAALIAFLAAWGQSMKSERDSIKAEFAEYKAEHAAADLRAAKAALAKTIEDERKKEAADAENEKLKRDLADATRRLRDARAGVPNVPAAPTGSKCPDGQACFDRAELERALRAFDEGLQKLVDEGSALIVDLDTAKRWAKDR